MTGQTALTGQEWQEEVWAFSLYGSTGFSSDGSWGVGGYSNGLLYYNELLFTPIVGQKIVYSIDMRREFLPWARINFTIADSINVKTIETQFWDDSTLSVGLFGRTISSSVFDSATNVHI